METHMITYMSVNNDKLIFDLSALGLKLTVTKSINSEVLVSISTITCLNPRSNVCMYVYIYISIYIGFRITRIHAHDS